MHSDPVGRLGSAFKFHRFGPEFGFGGWIGGRRLHRVPADRLGLGLGFTEHALNLRQGDVSVQPDLQSAVTATTYNKPKLHPRV
jgi:hypothetical protein